MSEVLGKDIKLVDGEIFFGDNQDFGIQSKEKNLQQAIINRLQTHKGEYRITEYGSRINDVLGQPMNDLLLSELRGYIIEALLQEPRINRIESLSLSFKEKKDLYEVKVDLVVTPIESNVPLNLIFPLFIGE